jgi:hypothetical protein
LVKGIESSVTSVSWIPSEAVRGMSKVPFTLGVAHHDEPPPEVLEDLEALRAADRFRFANELRAWIEVEDGRIVGRGHMGKGHIGSTTLRLGPGDLTVQGVPLPDLQPEPQAGETWVRFVQTAGGRTGVAVPRRVRRRPFVQITAPLAWTTLGLTIHADGSSEHEVIGASPFPRHWIYDHSGKVVAKTGLIEFKAWWGRAFWKKTPWGVANSPAVVTEVESALERELALRIMRPGAKPKVRTISVGTTLVEQGQPGQELFLVLDGVLRVEVDGDPLVEVGPGAVLGERAILEGGVRTSTLTAVTPCKVAMVRGDQVDPAALSEMARGHRREEEK